MRVVVCIALLVAPARAEIRPHVEASAWAGYAWGNRHSVGYDASQDGAIIDLRAALGLAFVTSSGTVVRGGAVVDVFPREPTGVAGGVEVQVDVALADWPGWRIGGRLAGGLGSGDSSPAAGDGQLLVPGVRLRNGTTFIGMDVLIARTGTTDSHGYANGVMFGAGLSDKPGAVVVGAGAVIAGIVGLLALYALRSTH
jgi:hypothetical protein